MHKYAFELSYKSMRSGILRNLISDMLICCFMFNKVMYAIADVYLDYLQSHFDNSKYMGPPLSL